MNPAADVWDKVLELMKPDMTSTTINTWFDDTSAVALEEDRFLLYSLFPSPSSPITANGRGNRL